MHFDVVSFVFGEWGVTLCSYVFWVFFLFFLVFFVCFVLFVCRFFVCFLFYFLFA